VVPRAGLEPAQAKARGILSPLRLPIPPSRQFEWSLILGQLEKPMQNLEAAPGFEPGIRDLQSRALPLGYAAQFALLE
jgi:hypothetical protein